MVFSLSQMIPRTSPPSTGPPPPINPSCAFRFFIRPFNPAPPKPSSSAMPPSPSSSSDTSEASWLTPSACNERQREERRDMVCSVGCKWK
jgi:hypothetical protein